MPELLLFVVVIAILLASNLVTQLKTPGMPYIRIIVSLALLALIWLFSENGNYPPKAILTAVALGSIFRQVLSLRRHKTNF